MKIIRDISETIKSNSRLLSSLLSFSLDLILFILPTICTVVLILYILKLIFG